MDIEERAGVKNIVKNIANPTATVLSGAWMAT